MTIGEHVLRELQSYRERAGRNSFQQREELEAANRKLADETARADAMQSDYDEMLLDINMRQIATEIGDGTGL